MNQHDEDGPCIGVCAGCEPDCPLLTLPPREPRRENPYRDWPPRR